jgi:site-specific DNA-methyltransferase (adenine-specific)
LPPFLKKSFANMQAATSMFHVKKLNASLLARHPLLLCRGDALEGLFKLPLGIAQCIIADPHYYNVLTKEAWDTQWEDANDYLDWSVTWVAGAMRALKEDGLCFIFGQTGKREHVFVHLMSRLCGQYPYHDLLIWDRVVGYHERRDSFTPAYEMILVLRKSGRPVFHKSAVRDPYAPETIATYRRDKRYKDPSAREAHLQAGKFSTNILRVPSLKGTSLEKCGHPSQKPLALIEKLIACCTVPGDLVVDPFLGSGTTALATSRLQRRCCGIESNLSYLKIAHQRLAQAGFQQI